MQSKSLIRATPGPKNRHLNAGGSSIRSDTVLRIRMDFLYYKEVLAIYKHLPMQQHELKQPESEPCKVQPCIRIKFLDIK